MLLFRHLATRYVNVHGKSDRNVFWPGHVLDRLRLFMGPDGRPESPIFHSTRQEKRANHGYNNDLRCWPMNARGYVQYASIP